MHSGKHLLVFKLRLQSELMYYMSVNCLLVNILCCIAQKSSLEEHAFNKFNVNLKSVQILFASAGQCVYLLYRCLLTMLCLSNSIFLFLEFVDLSC